MTDELNLPGEFRGIEQAYKDWFDDEAFKGGTPIWMAFLIPEMVGKLLIALSEARDETEGRDKQVSHYYHLAKGLRAHNDKLQEALEWARPIMNELCELYMDELWGEINKNTELELMRMKNLANPIDKALTHPGDTLKARKG